MRHEQINLTNRQMLPHQLAGEPILLIDMYSHATLVIDMDTVDGYAAEHKTTVNLSGNTCISVTECRAVHATKAKACNHGEWAACPRTAATSKLQQRPRKLQG